MSGDGATLSPEEVDALLEASSAAPRDEAELVYRAVSHALGALPGGSGHVSAYVLSRDSFVVESREALGEGRVRVSFSVTGSLLSEFDTEPLDDASRRPPTRIRGSITVDTRSGAALDLRWERVRGR
jgi:hypothetical protein